MAGPDEVRELREALNRLLGQADALARRIDALEQGDAAAPLARVAQPTSAALPTSPAPPRPPVRNEDLPPPLPVVPATQFASATPVAPYKPTTPVVSPAARAAEPPRHTPPVDILTRFRKASGLGDDAGWELIIGTWLIPRVAVAMLLIAAVFGLTMAMHHWGPPLRILAGYSVCAALLVAGWRLEGRHAPFARVLYSGGFALSYFVTFATHYVPYARVFATPEPALLLMGVAVVAWAGVAQWRQSRVMAFLVVLLGHGTVALSTITLDPPDKMAVAGLLVLAGGGAWFLLKNRWHEPALLSVVCCYLNFALWLMHSPSSDQWADFTMALCVLSLFFLIHALAGLFAPAALRQGKGSLFLRNMHVTLNSVGFFLVGTALLHGFAPARDHHDVFRLMFAAVLLALALAHLRLRAGDPVHNAYFTKAVLVATLGLAAAYDDTALSAAIAVQAFVLLLSSRLSGLPVTRMLAMATALFAVVVGLVPVVDMQPLEYTDPAYRDTLVQVLLMAGALWGCAALHERTDWRRRGINPDSVDPGLYDLLGPLDLLDTDDDEAPQSGPIMPAAYAAGGALITVVWSGFLFQTGHLPAALAGAALALALVGIGLRAASLGLASVILLLAAALWGIPSALNADPDWMAPVGAAVAAVALALLSEPRVSERAPGLGYIRKTDFFLWPAAAWLCASACFSELDPFLETAVLVGLAALALAACKWLQGKPLSGAALLLLLSAAVSWMSDGFNIDGFAGPEWTLHATAVLLVVAGPGGDQWVRRLQATGRAWPLGGWMTAIGMAVALAYAVSLADTYFKDFSMAAVAVVCAGFLAYGIAARVSKTALALSLLTALVSVLGLLLIRVTRLHHDSSLDLVMAVNFGLFAAYWVLVERAATIASAGHDYPAARIARVTPVVLVTLLLAVMMARMPMFDQYFLTIGWAVLAFALFGGSLALGQRLYRIAGLVMFALAIGRAALVDTRQLDGFYRVGAFAVLGLLLLIVGYGYFQGLALMRKTGPQDQV